MLCIRDWRLKAAGPEAQRRDVWHNSGNNVFFNPSSTIRYWSPEDEVLWFRGSGAEGAPALFAFYPLQQDCYDRNNNAIGKLFSFIPYTLFWERGLGETAPWSPKSGFPQYTFFVSDSPDTLVFSLWLLGTVVI